jgi:hypothetical protein
MVGCMRRLAAAAIVVLAACSPELDWREFTSAEGRFTVMLPARPTRESRELVLAGTKVRMQMVTAQVSGTAFGVGYADLPSAADAARTVSDIRDALTRNLGGRVISERPVDLDGATGIEFQVAGAAQGSPMRLAARVVAAGNRFYQVVVVGRAERVAGVDLTLFPGSFKLVK